MNFTFFVNVYRMEYNESTIQEYQKSQRIRLYDVFIIAPFLFYITFKKEPLRDWEKAGVGLIAAGTLLYNGRNYLINENK